MADQDRGNQQEQNDAEDAAGAERLGQKRSPGEASPPPGSGVINNSRSGQAVSENPITRLNRDASDVLADEVRDEREGSGADGG